MATSLRFALFECAPFRLGDRVKLERSNGSISYALIVEYDEVMKVYTVDVGSGILKYGVEESYITHVDHTGEWAGKHFIGRKVRVPSMGGRDFDKNGIIRGHSEGSDTYTVSFENGKILGGLTFEQVPCSRLVAAMHPPCSRDASAM